MADSVLARERKIADDLDARVDELEAENEGLKELLRTVACAIPAEWATSRNGVERRAYRVMSDFLTEDQRV